MRMSFKRCLNYKKQRICPEEEYVGKFIYRPLSNFFLFFYINLGISANTVSGLMALLAIIASFFYFIPNKAIMIIGTLLFIKAMILDYTDGDIANITCKYSKIGPFFDTIHHTCTELFIFPGLGIYSTVATGNPWFVFLGIGISITILAMQRFKFFMLSTLGIDLRKDMSFRKLPLGLLYGEFFKYWHWMILICLIFNWVPYFVILIGIWAVIRIPIIVAMFFIACLEKR